jgi:hypothetical protein
VRSAASSCRTTLRLPTSSAVIRDHRIVRRRADGGVAVSEQERGLARGAAPRVQHIRRQIVRPTSVARPLP